MTQSPLPRKTKRKSGARRKPKSPESAPAAAARKKAPRQKTYHHHVYVVLLSEDVWQEAKFRRCNPDRDFTKACVYVGMTGLDPDQRFDRHKAGIKANRYVERYGEKLLPHLYECYNPMPYEAARDMEVELAIALREAGYGVWQA